MTKRSDRGGLKEIIPFSPRKQRVGSFTSCEAPSSDFVVTYPEECSCNHSDPYECIGRMDSNDLWCKCRCKCHGDD